MAMPPIFRSGNNNGGGSGNGKKEVGVGTPSGWKEEENGAFLVNVADGSAKAEATSKGDPVTQMGEVQQTLPPPPPHSHSPSSSLPLRDAIGGAGQPLSAALSFTGNDEGDDGESKTEEEHLPSSSSPLLLAPLAEMEGISSLDSTSTFAASSSTEGVGERGGGGGNGGANQSVSESTTLPASHSPSYSSSNSHQSEEGEEERKRSGEKGSSARSIGLDASAEKEGERLMGTNDGGGKGMETRVQEEEEDYAAVGEKVMRIYKELDDAFNSLDKGQVTD